jgi:hypothetical protein
LRGLATANAVARKELPRSNSAPQTKMPGIRKDRPAKPDGSCKPIWMPKSAGAVANENRLLLLGKKVAKALHRRKQSGACLRSTPFIAVSGVRRPRFPAKTAESPAGL